MIKLEDLEVYKVAMEIGEMVYSKVNSWDNFNKETLGRQIVRAADSIGLNVSEGFGRFFYKENKNFCYYARGSAFETNSALTKAFHRNLITQVELSDFKVKFERFFLLLNAYIRSIGTTKMIND